MAAVRKDPHFLQKNPPVEFSGYGPGQHAWRGLSIFDIWYKDQQTTPVVQLYDDIFNIRYSLHKKIAAF